MKMIYETIMTSASSNFWAFSSIRRRLVLCSVFFLGFLFAGTQQANAALGLSREAYGVWDREGGHPVSAYPYARGQEYAADWTDINSARSNFNWTAMDALLQTAYDQNQRFFVKIQPISVTTMPPWIFDAGVPSFKESPDIGFTYGYYLDPEFKIYFSEMVKALGKHLREEVPAHLANIVSFVRVDTGATGDEEPYENPANVPEQYQITAADWLDYRLWVFGLYDQAMQHGTGPEIPLIFQDIETPDYQTEQNWVLTNVTSGFGAKYGGQVRGHHLTESRNVPDSFKAYSMDTPFKFFSANEMDQTFEKPYFQLNVRLGMYWAAVEQLNAGLTVWDWSGDCMEGAVASGFLFSATLFNEWAAELEPPTARGGFCIFHEGLDSSDEVKFPKAQYGNWPVNQGSTNRYTAICAAYSNQGARMDHLVAATWGQVVQRRDQNGFNDSGWEIWAGNYERFITQINPTNESLGLWRVRGTLSTSSHPYDRFARRFDRATGRNAMRFNVNDNLTPTSGQSIKLSVVYLDSGTNRFGLLYDAVGNSQKSAFTVTKANSNTWKTNSVVVTDWVFGNNGPNGSDLVLTNMDSSGDTTFSRIELTKLVDVTLNTVGRGTVSARNDATVYSPVTGTNYPTGLRLEMTVTPAAGATFTGWSGDLSGSNSRAILFPTNLDTQVTANFIDVLYTLTVNSGSGSGSYTNAQQVVIAASNAPSGKVFSQWTGNASYVANYYAPTTTVTMATWNASMTATYRDITYALTVNGGTGSGSYTNGRQVAISASNLTGKAFVQWIGDTQYVNNVTYTNALVTMSSNAVSLTATYADVYYALTVNSGTGGGGTYTNGTQVDISADAPAIGKAFVRWTGNTAYVADSNSASTTVTMPAQDVTLTATYVDLYYALTVTGGTGSGSYTNARQVAIAANAPTIGKAFSQWIGDTQYVASASSANTTVTMSTNAVSLTATYVDVYYPLTVTGGSGSGSYTNGRQVSISANAPAAGKAFVQWIGDTQYVNNITYTNALVTMSTNAVSLTATYVDVLYTLTVTGGSGSGSSYTNAQVVEISADAPSTGMTFDKWTGDTQVVNNVTYTNAQVTMLAQDAILTATYKNLPGYYTLTVSNGTGGGAYTNAAQVTITAVAPEGTVFDRWTGDTQIVAGVFSLNTTVTMPAQDAALTASCVDASNGVVGVTWASSFIYYEPNFDPLLQPDFVTGMGNKTIAQLMYSPDDTKDSILPNGAGSVNDVVWDTITLTEGVDDAYGVFSAATARAGTNGYVYALIFQDNTVQAGDLYVAGPLAALVDGLADVNTCVEPGNGEAINGANSAQVVEGTVTYVLTAGAGANGTVSPTNATVPAGNSTNFVVTASNYYRIATLTTNGTAVTGIFFDNNSTSTNFIWSNVQAAGVLSATFTAQVTTNTPAPVPYWWLAQYGLTNWFPEPPPSDSDGDGLKDWEEYIAGTVPTNKASVFAAAQSNRNVVTWSPVTGRIYSVYWSTNLVKGFAMKQDNILYPTNSYTNATPDSRVNHYQVKVRMQ